MTINRRPVRSLRRRLFGSHLLVIAVALAVLAIVVALIQLMGEGRALDMGRRSDGGPSALLLGLAAAVIASAIVSWRTTKRLVRPIDAVGAATRQLAAGQYDVRLPGSDTLELDALASDVNQLATELETTEQRRLRLIGDVAHELRNPLSTIEGTMEALLDGVVPSGDETYARVGREAARLRRLADDLSSLSAAGELGVVDRRSVDLSDLVTNVVAQLEPQALAKDLALVREPSAAWTVFGDRDRLTQVVMNVIGNAVQYTDDGEVVVRLSSSQETVVVEVTDSGRGLAADDQTRIFDRFHRVDEHFADGTGVGLAIAKLIVEAHGGHISAHSEGLGRGTTLRVELPAHSSSSVS